MLDSAAEPEPGDRTAARPGDRTVARPGDAAARPPGSDGPAADPAPDAGSPARIVALGDAGTGEKSESTLTVLIAFVANLLVAVAKTWAAALTGSASLVPRPRTPGPTPATRSS